MATGRTPDSRSGGIAGRIRSLVLAISGVALLLASAACSVFEYNNSRDALIRHLSVLAQIIADNSSAAITFGDQKTAVQVLRTLRAQEDVHSAALLLPTGEVFAREQWQDTDPTPDSDHSWRLAMMGGAEGGPAYRFDEHGIDVLVPIRLEREVIGYLHIEGGLQRLYQQTAAFLSMVAVLYLLLVGGVYLLSNRLQRRITGPIRELAQAMHHVSEHRDYTPRVNAESSDEVGDLIAGFNEMLGQIEVRDRAVADSRPDLEDKVAECTADLAEAKDLAEAGSRAKSEFLATLGHEIRTPMNGVLGMTELLLGSGLAPRQQRLAENAHRCAENLLGLIDNILDFSTIDAGRLELNPEDVELRSFFDDTLELFADQARRKGVEIVADLPPDLPYRVHCDATRLRQILFKLLANAVKFTRQGEVRLHADAANLADGTIALNIEVGDTGPGIAESQRAHIFEPVFQADGSASRGFSGTGLGLAITQRLVQLMGGEIQLKSEPGHGSRFKFSIRVQPADSPDSGPTQLRALAGLRVLVVDGHATNREMLGKQILAWGLRKDCAADAEEALVLLRKAAAEDAPYRIAILDWHLPGMDGMALARAIKADPLIPVLSLIMLGSAGDDEPAMQDRDVGIACYLSEPASQDQLLACLLESQTTRPSDDTRAAPDLARSAEFAHTRVLLAEDNSVNREVVLGMLEPLGCKVDLAQNGKQAIEAVKQQRYQLILMDCHMPVVDGFEATAKIRDLEQQHRHPRTPIVALNADVQKDIEQQSNNAGIDDYLSKAFDQHQLTCMLKKWLPARIDAGSTASVAPMVIGSNGILDGPAIAQLRQLSQARGQDVLGQVAGLFLDEVPRLLSAIRAGVQAGDAESVRQAAHALKSVGTNLGALTFSRHCGELETAAHDGHTSQFDELLATLESSATLATQAVASLLESGPQVPAHQVRNDHPAINAQRILVVDDDAAFRFATSEVLSAEGFITEGAANGEQALATLSRQQPDLILLDALMDGMDGFETCRQMRRLPNGKDVPVIMVTGFDDGSSAEQAFHVGATGFVSKPVTYPALIQRIRFMLRASANESELRNHKAMLQTAQRVARLGYWRWEQATGRFEMSENLCEMCGITPADFAGTPDAYLQFVASEDRDHVRARLQAAFHERQLGTFDYRIGNRQDEPIIVQQDLELVAEGPGLCLLGTVQDVTRQRRSEDQIRKMAYYDALTGLASRSHLMQHLEDTIKAARRREEAFTILFLDLDGFKDVNDSLGHDVGDFMLVSVARRLQGVIRDVDFVARLGGDEFCIMLEDNRDELDAAEVASRCLDAVSRPIELGKQSWRPQVSIGLARFPEDGDNAGLLLKAADSAMYAAKKAGKHRYAFYRPEMTEEAERRLANEQMLRTALEQEQFELHYQPQIDLHSGRMIGVEALARWRHPQYGIVMPDDFIPTLERIGLIRNLGTWVISTACRQAAAWMRAGLNDLRVAVNISPLHFHDAGILDAVSNALRESHLPPHLFEMEITESSVQSDTKAMVVLQQLQSLGIRISIDDFGTGYSSLGSLKHLPINTLKIDRVFVADMLDNNEDAVMLGTIIGLAHALGYTVVAEGVEDREQATVLAGLKCDLAQGYYFARPVEAAQIPALVRRGSYFSPQTQPPIRLGAVSAGGKDA